MKFNDSIYPCMVVVVLSLMLLPSAVFARSTNLVEPDPVTIQCGLSAEKMKSAIAHGGSVRNWTVVSQNAGNTVLKYDKGNGKHIFWVNVTYTANRFAVTYKDSHNLKYFVDAEGNRHIHPRPVGWMKNLSADIQVATDNLCGN